MFCVDSPLSHTHLSSAIFPPVQNISASSGAENWKFIHKFRNYIRGFKIIVLYWPMFCLEIFHFELLLRGRAVKVFALPVYDTFFPWIFIRRWCRGLVSNAVWFCISQGFLIKSHIWVFFILTFFPLVILFAILTENPYVNANFDLFFH